MSREDPSAIVEIRENVLEGSISAYQETPRIRLVAQPTSDGIVTVQIFNHLRQGISIRTEKEKGLSIRPLFLQNPNSGEDVGYTNVQKNPEFFVDDDRYDPTTYLNTSGTLVVQPQSDNVLNDGSNKYDGSIQPLEIVTQENISNKAYWPIVFRGFKGQLMGGNEQAFNRGSEQIVQIISRVSSSNNPFFDEDAGYFGIPTGSATVSIPGKESLMQRTIAPYDDALRQKSTIMISDSINSVSGTAMIDAILASTASESIQMFHESYKSTTAGFDFRNSYYGTDSIAFGGLLR